MHTGHRQLRVMHPKISTTFYDSLATPVLFRTKHVLVHFRSNIIMTNLAKTQQAIINAISSCRRHKKSPVRSFFTRSCEFLRRFSEKNLETNQSKVQPDFARSSQQAQEVKSKPTNCSHKTAAARMICMIFAVNLTDAVNSVGEAGKPHTPKAEVQGRRMA